MTDVTPEALAGTAPSEARKALTRRRYAAERRFRAYGIAAVAVGLLALVFLLGSILHRGLPAFSQTYVRAEVFLDPAALDPSGTRDEAAMKKVLTFAYAPLIKASLTELADELAAGPAPGLTPALLAGMVSDGASAQLRNYVLANPDELGRTVEFDFLTTGRIDQFAKGRITRESAAGDGKLDPAQLDAAEALRNAGVLTTRFNWAFLTSPDASENRPEAAGLGVALIGSAYMMLIVLTLSLPIGVAASIYLEEFAPKNRLTDLIEVNISNLAAVPSIVFGILGLAIFINFLHLPMSAPIVGGLVLTLMTLPTIIISTRVALK
ncbi:DUF3333 domain-containing protein, partial [Amaricoccus sp.]|uniref:DUF3333 domain-containing protein n=1 Tax=Amaricoccus sp. TaxID=1872485 RepID=UPI001B4D7F6A